MPILDRFKLVVRETQNWKVIQIHEVYKLNLGNMVNQVMEEHNYDVSITITKLK